MVAHTWEDTYVLRTRPEFKRMRRLAILTAFFALALLSPKAYALDLAAHKAEYALKLENSRGGDVTAASGKMFYEVIDACDGWAVRQRLEMRITNQDGQDVNMVSDYTTFESKDGLNMRFRMKQTTEQAVTSEVEGNAKLDRVGGPGIATYTLPEATTKALPAGTLFPTAHTAALIAAAEAGKKFLALPLFDGTSPGGAQESSIVVNGWGSASDTKWSPLANIPSGRVRIAFFDRDAASTLPDYEVAMRYWANGIADDLSMDFGDFVMAGKLVKLTVAKPGC